LASKAVKCVIISWIFFIGNSDILCRAFNHILKDDRAKYGADKEYVIGDTVPDEWQQRVDDVVAGMDIT
jgi:hypothetical protein